jgi:hypothetical protein
LLLGYDGGELLLGMGLGLGLVGGEGHDPSGLVKGLQVGRVEWAVRGVEGEW